MSRTTLRAALRDLKNDGLVEIVPRRGCFVARMSPDEIQDVCFARYLLEAGAACEQRAHVDQSLFTSLEQELVSMRAAAGASDVAGIVDSDTRFHSLIAESGGRRKVVELWHSLDGKMGSLMRSSLDRQGMVPVETVTMHQVLLDALRTGNAVMIEQAIKVHYMDTRTGNLPEVP